MNLDLDIAVKRALELSAFMEDVPYRRYERDVKGPLKRAGPPEGVA